MQIRTLYVFDLLLKWIEIKDKSGTLQLAVCSLYQYTVFWCRCIIYCFWLMVWGYRTSTKCCVHVLEIHISLLAFGKMLKYGINDKAPQFFFSATLKKYCHLHLIFIKNKISVFKTLVIWVNSREPGVWILQILNHDLE